MHKPVRILISDGGTPGRLAALCRKLAKKNVNILAIGGAEWDHRGAVALMLDKEDENEVHAILAELRDEQGLTGTHIYEEDWLPSIELELPDRPGSLADVLEILATDGDDGPGIDVLTVLSFPGRRGSNPTAYVSIGVGTQEERDRGRTRLGSPPAMGEHFIRDSLGGGSAS